MGENSNAFWGKKLHILQCLLQEQALDVCTRNDMKSWEIQSYNLKVLFALDIIASENKMKINENEIKEIWITCLWGRLNAHSRSCANYRVHLWFLCLFAVFQVMEQCDFAYAGSFQQLIIPLMFLGFLFFLLCFIVKNGAGLVTWDFLIALTFSCCQSFPWLGTWLWALH